MTVREAKKAAGNLKKSVREAETPVIQLQNPSGRRKTGRESKKSGISAKNLVDGEKHVRERFRSDRLSPAVRADVLIPLGGRAAVDEEGAGIQVDQPGLGDAGLGVEVHLHSAVEGEGGIGHLDHQKGITGRRRGGRVAVVLEAQESDVRLRLRLLIPKL